MKRPSDHKGYCQGAHSQVAITSSLETEAEAVLDGLNSDIPHIPLICMWYINESTHSYISNINMYVVYACLCVVYGMLCMLFLRFHADSTGCFGESMANGYGSMLD